MGIKKWEIFNKEVGCQRVPKPPNFSKNDQRAQNIEYFWYFEIFSNVSVNEKIAKFQIFHFEEEAWPIKTAQKFPTKTQISIPVFQCTSFKKSLQNASPFTSPARFFTYMICNLVSSRNKFEFFLRKYI